MNGIENQAKSLNENLTGGSLKGALGYAALNGGLTESGAQGAQGAFGSFKDELEKFIVAEASGNEFNIDDILKDMDIGEVKNLDTAHIGQADALFFINLTNQAGLTNYNVKDDGSVINALDYKGIEVSKTLSDILLKASQTKQAVRLDFDNNVTVVLKLSDAGKLNAHFIPGDKAVEEYLRNNIPYLKQRFDEQNIPYANISYRQQKQRENGQNNKEKNNE